MQIKSKSIVILAVFILLLAACGGLAEPQAKFEPISQMGLSDNLVDTAVVQTQAAQSNSPTPNISISAILGCNTQSSHRRGPRVSLPVTP